ncbi:unnamed protein product [Closterium sp. NIES-54]
MVNVVQEVIAEERLVFNRDIMVGVATPVGGQKAAESLWNFRLGDMVKQLPDGSWSLKTMAELTTRLGGKGPARLALKGFAAAPEEWRVCLLTPAASSVGSTLGDRGGEFSSDLLRAFCRLEGIRQTFTLPASPQQNGIAERRIGMVMDVARTSMIHAAAPHFLWPFAVQYTAHQINLQPRVSLPETTPTLRWTGKVGDASAFRVWGSRDLVRDTTEEQAVLLCRSLCLPWLPS